MRGFARERRVTTIGTGPPSVALIPTRCFQPAKGAPWLALQKESGASLIRALVRVRWLFSSFACKLRFLRETWEGGRPMARVHRLRMSRHDCTHFLADLARHSFTLGCTFLVSMHTRCLAVRNARGQTRSAKNMPSVRGRTAAQPEANACPLCMSLPKRGGRIL